MVRMSIGIQTPSPIQAEKSETMKFERAYVLNIDSHSKKNDMETYRYSLCSKNN